MLNAPSASLLLNQTTRTESAHIQHTTISKMKHLQPFAIFVTMSLCLPLYLQGQWHDVVWLFGYESGPGGTNPEFGGSVVDFNDEPPITFHADLAFNFDVTHASICDSLGNLLFYTNGVAIANYTHQIMENGDSLNPGEITWNHTYSGLAVAQSHIILPWPEHPQQYYLFHERLELHPQLVLAVYPMYYSVIDMSQNNSLGKVLQKNVVIFKDSTHNYGTMVAVKHANGRDWWILAPQLSKNIFYRVLFTPQGVVDTAVLNIQPNYPMLGSNAFMTFSPDGSILARYEIQHGLYLYNFDRCSGTLQDTPYFLPIPDTQLGGGVAFSPNGRFLYMLSSTFVLQLDLQEPDPNLALDTVAFYDGFTFDGLATRFFAMQRGPDGRIYFNTTNSTPFLHTIIFPNRKGDSCSVLQHQFQLPTINAFTSPYFPNYRLGPLDGSPCDSLGLNNLPLADWRHEADYLQLQFIDNSFYQPMDWFWDFGDGTSSSTPNPKHIYLQEGTYQVCLSVANQYAADTLCRIIHVHAPQTSATKPLPNYPYRLYPNPASQYVSILFPQGLPTYKLKWTLFNSHGTIIHQQDLSCQNNPNGSCSTNITLPPNIPPSIYVWGLQDLNGQILARGKIGIQ